MSSRVKTPDGRSARWDDHRESRRAELVEAAVAAIDRHGAGASIAEIAQAAGVSKPVLYRYFSDKDDLYRAVGHWGADRVLAVLMPALRSRASIRDKINRGCREYFKLINAHPNVFFLLVEHRIDGDPLADGKERIAAAFSRALGDGFRALGLDGAPAEPWAHGLVGMGLAQGEWWLHRRTMSRTAAADHLAAFIWHAFSGVAADAGIDLEDTRLRLVSPKKRKDAADA